MQVVNQRFTNDKELEEWADDAFNDALGGIKQSDLGG